MSAPRPAILSAPGLQTAVLYAATFAAMGVFLPFWPLWLADKGLSDAEIGAYSAAGMAARVAAGIFVPALADRLDARRAVLLALGLTGAAATLAHPLAPIGPWLLLATLVVSGAFSGMIPLGDALGAAAARVYGFGYAQARSAGSLAFLLVSLAMGSLVAWVGIGIAVPVMAGFFAAAALSGYTHPGGGRAKALVRPSKADFTRLITSRSFLVFTAAIGFAQSSHAVYYAYSSVHWRALGLGDGEIGALWAFGVAVEVALMLLWGGKLVAKFGPAGTIALSGLAGTLRWSAMALDPVGPALWALQGLHAVSFAAGHLGAIAFIQAAAPERLAAAAQGLYGAAGQGLLVAGSMALAAMIYPVAGGMTYLMAAAMAAVGCGFALALRTRWHGGPIA
ncbi:MFS transporter [Rhodovulum sp. DZ06]|uniref:MFS transporter n=1 Tax=Rhodovulum sp. DZ06 TaxID=3425126 RepID=UPI003D334DBC